MTLALNQTSPDNVLDYLDGYTVARRLREMADPAAPTYQPAWAALAENIGVRRRVYRGGRPAPPVCAARSADAGAFESPRNNRGRRRVPERFRRLPAPTPTSHFVANPLQKFPTADHPQEIVERYFETSDAAVDALRARGSRRGGFSVSRRCRAAGVRSDSAGGTLRLPTIHVLVPNHDKVLTGNQTFRRALAYGIGRQAILDAEVLGNLPIPGCQLISGPFPIGTRDNDPLAYAYDQRIPPRPYDPRLATTLVTLARRELEEVAKKRGTPLAAESRLVLSYPRNQLVRVSCQAIGQYLKVIGVECELRELPPGAWNDSTGQSDLVYMQVALWEPLTDARRLLAPTGVAAGGNEYVGMALRRLEASRNWREARTRLHELHRIVEEQVAIIPLWQTVNFLAYRKRLQGFTPRPLTLYEDVEQWHIAGEGP